MTFNYVFVFCILLAVPCDSPQDGVETVSVNTSISYVFGENYTYECIDGYEYSGELVSTCQSDGNWSLPAPTCTGKLELCMQQYCYRQIAA